MKESNFFLALQRKIPLLISCEIVRLSNQFVRIINILLIVPLLTNILLVDILTS